VTGTRSRGCAIVDQDPSNAAGKSLKSLCQAAFNVAYLMADFKQIERLFVVNTLNPVTTAAFQRRSPQSVHICFPHCVAAVAQTLSGNPMNISRALLWVGFALAIVLTGWGVGADSIAAQVHAASADAVGSEPTESGPSLKPRELLGQRIFNDKNLSEPRGTACVSCHVAATGFSNMNGASNGTAKGSLGLQGIRAPMTSAYTGLIPEFSFETEDGVTEAVGGRFWDGRAATMALQATMPFLNKIEMNNADAAAVMKKIEASSYAQDFRAEFGADVFANPEAALQQAGLAIEAFERSAPLQAFSSKYDHVLRGQATLSASEQRGMALFRDPLKANCAGCHLMNTSSGNPLDSPFSEFSFYATGVPRNTAIAENADPDFYDLGLCGPERTKPTLPADVAAAGLRIESFCGQFRMPTLRNVALREAFMHNGVFTDLREVVRFYATRISNPETVYGSKVASNDLPAAYVGNIEKTKPPFNRSRADGPVLNEQEIDDLVGFLGTLSDGYQTPSLAN
jgi:cytochrome c peroxidase